MFLRLFILATLIFTMSVSIFAQSDIPPIEKGVSQKLAKWRAENYSDVRYKLHLTIEKKAPTLKGTIEVRVRVREGENEGNKISQSQSRSISPVPIILDWRKIKGHENLSKVGSVSINGTKLRWNPGESNSRHPMYETVNEHIVFKDGVKSGENVIKLDFESPILTSGSAITRYIDKEDGSEYIYSLFVPSDASTAFPVFDQPDLKAGFKLTVNKPKDWKIISNALGESSEVVYSDTSKSREFITEFVETKPISTYVFAFAAGQFTRFGFPSEPSKISASEKKEIYDKWLSKPISVLISSENAARIKKENIEKLSNGFDSDSKDFSHIYVRKSQAEKFKPHAEEIFRLNRESIKYFEDYFDYKFPFPKYDLVLIPEFPFGGMEHAGATFLRESSIIFPSEPTANNYISRASLLFHENAHQWFGDTVTMKWFDDLWLKEGFATFMAYKAMEKVLPEYDVWKVFYERTKQRAYLTDVTKGTTPIYQEIPNLNSAKSAYGNIVYQKAPSFLKQAEFYLGEKKFQTAVRSFLKKHEYANAEWSDLVDSFEKGSRENLKDWADVWVTQPGVPVFTAIRDDDKEKYLVGIRAQNNIDKKRFWKMKTLWLVKKSCEKHNKRGIFTDCSEKFIIKTDLPKDGNPGLGSVAEEEDFNVLYFFPNYQDYGYGIFLLDEKSKKYILANIQNEKDDFLRSMMWGSLWDSVRFAELNPKDYVELAIKNIEVEKDVSTISSILGRVSTAMTYYIKSEPSAVADGLTRNTQNATKISDANLKLSATADSSDNAKLIERLEKLLINKMQTAKTQGERITFYRSFLGIASSESAKQLLKDILNEKTQIKGFKLRTQDKFNIVTRLIILGDKEAPKLLAKLEKTEKGDAAKRYAYAAKAGFATKENKEKYWNDFVNNKEISESWIEAACGIWNSPSHSELTLPYLEKALAELPNHKQNRKIFFVNGWTASFIGGQKSETALKTVNKFLKDNPNLDVDLRRKILERLDGLERAVKIRETVSKEK